MTKQQERLKQQNKDRAQAVLTHLHSLVSRQVASVVITKKK